MSNVNSDSHTISARILNIFQCFKLFVYVRFIGVLILCNIVWRTRIDIPLEALLGYICLKSRIWKRLYEVSNNGEVENYPVSFAFAA